MFRQSASPSTDSVGDRSPEAGTDGTCAPGDSLTMDPPGADVKVFLLNVGFAPGNRIEWACERSVATVRCVLDYSDGP